MVTMTEGHVKVKDNGDKEAGGSAEVVYFPGSERLLAATLDSEAIATEITKRILDAETPEQMFDVFEARTSDALVGKRFRLTGATWGWYAADRSDIPLARVEAVDLETGEETVFPTTSRNLTAFLFNAQTRGLLPIDVRIAGDKTRSGQTALRFERP